MYRLLPLLLVLFLTCNRSTADVPAAYDETIELPVGKSCAAPKARTPVTFLGVVEDSRCPTGTSCIRAGEVVFRIRVGPVERTMALPASRKGTLVTELSDARLSIYNVLPYPAAGQRTKAEDYRLELAFTPR